MSQDQKKIYVGNGKQNKAGGINININLSKIAAEASEHIFAGKNGKYINLTIWENKGGADQYGNTHSVQVNTYKPEEKPQAAAVTAEPAKSIKSDDLPF